MTQFISGGNIQDLNLTFGKDVNFTRDFTFDIGEYDLTNKACRLRISEPTTSFDDDFETSSDVGTDIIKNGQIFEFRLTKDTTDESGNAKWADLGAIPANPNLVYAIDFYATASPTVTELRIQGNLNNAPTEGFIEVPESVNTSIQFNSGAINLLINVDSDVIRGPAASNDNAIPLFDGTTGKLMKDSSGLIVAAAGVIGEAGSSLGFYGTAGILKPDSVSAEQALTNLGLASNIPGLGVDRSFAAISLSVDWTIVNGSDAPFDVIASFGTNAPTLSAGVVTFNEAGVYDITAICGIDTGGGSNTHSFQNRHNTTLEGSFAKAEQSGGGGGSVFIQPIARALISVLVSDTLTLRAVSSGGGVLDFESTLWEINHTGIG